MASIGMSLYQSEGVLSMFQSKRARLCLLLPLATIGLSLGGCVGAGAYNGLSNEPMSMVVAWRNPDVGPMTESQYRKVVRHANFCHEVAQQQLADPAETILVDTLTGGVTGAAGVAGGAVLGGVGTLGPMAAYGGVAGAANGAMTGARVQSNATAAVVGGCVSMNLTDAATREPGLHAMTAYVRSNNQSEGPPSWVVPDGAVRQQPVREEDSSDSLLITQPPLP